MDLKLNLFSLTPTISAFVVQISLRKPNISYAEGTVTITQRRSRRKTDIKFVNNDPC